MDFTLFVYLLPNLAKRYEKDQGNEQTFMDRLRIGESYQTASFLELGV